MKCVWLVVAFALPVATQAETLLLPADDVVVKCEDPRNFGKNMPTAYRMTTVRFGSKGKIFKFNDEVRDPNTHAVLKSCLKAQQIENQALIAQLLRKRVEFDDQTFRAGVEGLGPSSEAVLDPNQIKLECKEAPVVDERGAVIRSARSAFRVATIRLGDSFSRTLNDVLTDNVGAVIAGSQCETSGKLKAVIEKAKARKTKVRLNLDTFASELDTGDESHPSPTKQ